MNISGILGLEPTLSEYRSESLLMEIMQKEDWRCYPGETCEESRDLANRFLQYHSTVPGFISEEMRAREPAAVLYFVSSNRESVKGGVFKNGCVLVVHSGGEEVVSLFIDDASAQRLNYPDKGYVYMTQQVEETKNEEA